MQPKLWAKWLSLAEWWYNSSYHSSLKHSPFEVLYGILPSAHAFPQQPLTGNQEVDVFLQDRQRAFRLIKENLSLAQNRMKVYADKKRSERSFNVGDLVYLRLQPYWQHTVSLRQSLKLAPRYFGPYRILAKIWQVAYKLELPDDANIHPILHVSQLKKHISPSITFYDSYDAARKGESSKLKVKLIDAAGLGFPLGVIFGSCFSLVRGIRMVPKGSKDRFINCLRESWGLARIDAIFIGGQVAGYCTLFEVIEYGVANIRQKNDRINTPVAGALCGCMLDIRKGFRYAGWIGLRDGAFFTAVGLASFACGRRDYGSRFEEKEKNKNVTPMVIPALAKVQQTPRSTFFPFPRTNDESLQLHKFSNIQQEFGGLYTTPKLRRPYLSSVIKMDWNSSAKDKGI